MAKTYHGAYAIFDTPEQAASLKWVLALQNERLGQLEASRTEDFVEGVTAFAGKRTPEFKGR